MRQFINGRVYEIPTSPDGTIPVDVVRKTARIPDSRVLIMKRANGSNEIINPDENLRINPGQHFCDAPITERG